MLQLEISQATIAKSEPEVKLNLADDVMRLLNVRERNSEMAKDWLIFISTSNFKVTAGEIYLAFQMAISREITDSNGKEIDLFPELSNNTTGKVISAYIKHKKESLQYQLSKDKLKALKSPENSFSEKDKLQIRENLIVLVYDEISKTGFSADAYHFFSDLESKGKIDISVEAKKDLYRRQLKVYEIEEKAFIRNKYKTSLSARYLNELADRITGKTPVESVSNKCRSILASNYLYAFKNFETFKNELT
jgi:hypothetical protein